MTLRLKGAVPVAPRSIVPRPELEAALDDAVQSRLTTLVAGPGFGKTTLLAGWSSQRSHVRWYSVGRKDRALAVLTRGLMDALDVSSPGLSSALGSLSARKSDGRLSAEVIGGLLTEALDLRPDASFTLILDDVQELRRGSASARLIETIIREAPASLHVVISSRSPPPFAVERLRARGQVAALDPARLAFSVEDVDALVTATMGDRDPDLSERLHELSSGWPAAVRLALEALRSAPPAERSALLG